MAKISVIIPFRPASEKDKRYFDIALASVYRQTFSDFDIIICCNDPQIDISDIRKRSIGFPRLHWIDEKKPGLSNARNICVDFSKSEYFLSLDHDDFLDKDCLKSLYDKYPGSGFVYGSVMLFWENGKKVFAESQKYNFGKILSSVFFTNGTLQKKSDWKIIGGWDTSIKVFEDWDYWITAGEKGICGFNIPDLIYWYRQNESGLVHSVKKDKEKLEKAKEVIRKKHILSYQGVFEMACCGNKNSASISVPTVTASVVSELPGIDGMTIVKYIGGNVGIMSFYGPITGTRYKFGGSRPLGYIDTRDARTGNTRNLGLLEIVENGRYQFEESQPVKETEFESFEEGPEDEEGILIIPADIDTEIIEGIETELTKSPDTVDVSEETEVRSVDVSGKTTSDIITAFKIAGVEILKLTTRTGYFYITVAPEYLEKFTEVLANEPEETQEVAEGIRFKVSK